MISPEIETMLAINKAELPAKIDGYDLIIKRLGSLEDFYKDRASLFNDLAKKCGNAQDRLKENIKFAMKELGETEIAGNDVRFKLVAAKPSVVIDDEAVIPKEYLKTVTTYSVDKTKLREDLAIGSIAGAHLEETVSLRTYGNTAPALKGKSK